MTQPAKRLISDKEADAALDERDQRDPHVAEVTNLFSDRLRTARRAEEETEDLWDNVPV